MKYGLVVFTDGREGLLERTLDSFYESVSELPYVTAIVNDSANQDYLTWLEEKYANVHDKVYILTPDRDNKIGFAGVIQIGWRFLRKYDIDYAFHLEDDFTFNEPIRLTDMAKILDVNSTLAQVALKRQPWNEQEKAAGGIVEMWPNLYTPFDTNGGRVIVHDLFFTTNPSLYRRELMDRNWPQQERSEEVFTKGLREDGFKFCFLGDRFDPPKVTHIGDHRAGVGY